MRIQNSAPHHITTLVASPAVAEEHSEEVRNEIYQRSLPPLYANAQRLLCLTIHAAFKCTQSYTDAHTVLDQTSVLMSHSSLKHVSWINMCSHTAGCNPR